jgi:stage V sporulation protein D (sporulation-specific penicillin-binding protein)
MKPRKKPIHTSTADRRRNKRAVLLGVVLCLCMGYLVYQMWDIQTVRGEEYRRRSSEWRIDRVDHLSPPIVPNRGWIMDRNMQPLATSHPVYTVVLDLVVLAERENIAIERNRERRPMEETLTALHKALDIPMAELQALFVWDAAESRWRPVIRDYWRRIARDVPANIAIPLRDGFQNIHLEEVSQRIYPDPFFAPQVLGFLRGDAQWGLEGHYHTALTGIPGQMFRAFGADNTLIRDGIPVQHGMNLLTTLDSDIQRLAQATVDATFRNIPSDAVAIIVMQPHTGEILAMAQAPNYSLAAPTDPFFYTDPAIYSAWPDLTEAEQTNQWFNIWRNYNTTRSFEPGSIFKPIVVAAALEEGVISPHDTFFCNGVVHVAGTDIICFDRIAHGTLTVSEVISRSCNVAMIEIMGRLGRNQFYRYRGEFGYGERTGIDLPGEEAVSSPLVMYALNQLGPVQLATSSIGQGFNNTAIQAIISFAALINGGNIMRPYIVSHVIDAQGAVVQENRPQVVRRVISTQTADWMRLELQSVITSGTGRQTQIPGHAIGGKTGTAQRGALREDISLAYWVYTPVENPEFIILGVIDNVQEAGRTAGNTLGPILRGFLEELILIKNLPPSEGPYVDDWQRPVLGQELMPDFAGDPVADVVRNLINRDINFQIHGGGSVVDHHFPAPGRSIPQANSIPVQLYTDSATRIPEGMTFMPNVTGLPATQAMDFIRDAALIPVWSGGDGELAHYEVYRQYPSAGTETVQGMQVLLRMRRR